MHNNVIGIGGVWPQRELLPKGDTMGSELVLPSPGEGFPEMLEGPIPPCQVVSAPRSVPG